MYITLAKANTSVDMAKFKPYTGTSYEKREKDVGKGRVLWLMPMV